MLFTYPFFCFLFSVFVLSIHALEQGSWIDVDKESNEFVLEWGVYEVPDDHAIMLLKQQTPVYAAAMAPFQIEIIEAFRKLPYEKQTKIARYLDYPEDFCLENCLPYLEDTLIDEVEQDVELQSHEPSGTLHYLVMAKSKEGKLLGFANFHLAADQMGTVAELEPIMIDPNAQGNGLARKLIFSILQLKPDVQKIYLRVNSKNLVARKVYGHLGFKEAGTVTLHDIDWEYSVGIVMEHVFIQT